MTDRSNLGPLTIQDAQALVRYVRAMEAHLATSDWSDTDMGEDHLSEVRSIAQRISHEIESGQAQSYTAAELDELQKTGQSVVRSAMLTLSSNAPPAATLMAARQKLSVGNDLLAAEHRLRNAQPERGT